MIASAVGAEARSSTACRGTVRSASAATALGVLLGLFAAGCGSGGDEGATATLTKVSATDYVTILSTTTTTTTTTTIATGAGGAIEVGRTVEEAHTIVAGDSLARLSSRYDVAIESICSYNGWSDCIDPPHLLLPGDTVLIPPDPAAVAAAAEAAAGTDPAATTPADGTTATTGTGCSHTIALGENPTRVANQYGLSFDQLQAANPSMDFTTTFVVGDVLTIPPEGTC